MPAAARLAVLDGGPYLTVADAALRLLSVFDDLRYDRADLDMVSAPMRRHALARLAPLGFAQVSGLVIAHREEDVRIHLPRYRALGASPFDALPDGPMAPGDFALLTPTQAAARIITAYPTAAAHERLEALVARHPVNLLRLFDYLDGSARHQAFKDAIGHLMFVQREAVSRAPLSGRRALR